jgi:D-beta-D-heptose 7-phosphate kinase / D-beta-D-heptose 1-phosphate adenosyltransferase
MAQDGDLLAAVERLRAARVLCIGDVMLDHYVYGTSDRLSPEAPVPVLAIDSETHNLGGAGNVLRNLAALGAEMSFVSVVGNDAAGREIQNLLAALDGAEIHVLVQPHRVTTVKTRFIAVNQHLLRADRESAAPLGPYIRDDLLRLVRELVTSHNVVAISDYAKGVLTDGVALEIINMAHEAGARVVVEPKGGDSIRYRGADLVTPTRRELAQATGMSVASTAEITAAARALIERCGFGAVVTLLGRDGMILIDQRQSVSLGSTVAGDGYDPSGAEDAALAVLASGLGADLPLATAAQLAAVAVRIAGGRAGTAIASAGELAAVLANGQPSEPAEPALRIEVAPQPRRRRQREAQREGAASSGRQSA